MKRIFLITSLVAASTGAFAQSKTPVAPASTSPAIAQQANMSREVTPAVSKNAFAAEVKELDGLIAANKMEEAKNKWNEVSNVMMNSLREMAGKVRTANESKNEEDKKRAMEQMTKQRVIYGESMKLREDMAANREKLNAKLNEFTTVMAQ